MAAAEIGSQKKMTDLDDGVVSKVEDEFELPSLFYCRLYKFLCEKKNPQLNTNAPLICSLNSDLELRTRKSLRQRDTGCSSLKSSRKNQRESKQLWPFSCFTVPPRGTHTFCSAPLFNPLILFYFCWPLHVGSGRPDSVHWPSGSPSLSSEVSVAVRYPAITPLFCFALLSLFSEIVSPHFELPGRAFQPFIFLILLCVDRGWEQRITGFFRSISLGGGVFILYCEWCFCSGF